MNLILTIIAAAAAAAVPATTTPADLSWMAGTWIAEGQGSWTEEHWSRPRAGVMLGTALTGKDEAAHHFEYMRIAPDETGRAVFWASPMGKAASPFPRQESRAGEVVFANPAHDYPQRIVYRRDGETLIATISLADGSKPQSWRFRRAPSR